MVRFEDVARGADAVLDSEIKKLVYAGETKTDCRNRATTLAGPERRRTE